jgi:hypothetical protein
MYPRPSFPLAISLGFTALILVGPPAVAQVELTPYVGIVVPTGTLYEVERYFTIVPTDDPIESWQHRPNVNVGTRLTWWLSSRFGLEGALSFSPSDIGAGSGDEQPSRIPREATLLTATGRALVQLGLNDGTRLHLAAGLGVLSHGGPAFATAEGTSGLTGVLGAGLDVKLAPHISIRFDLEDYLSSSDLTWPLYDDTSRRRQGNTTGPAVAPPVTTNASLNQYFVLSAGSAITLPGW